MQHNTYANLTITHGNITIRDVKGDISFTVPNDIVNVELDARGNQISASNVQGLVRTIGINIGEGTVEDRVWRTVLDAQNKPTAQNRSLIGLPLVITKTNSDGFVTYSFLNILITSRRKQDDVLYSTDGNVNQSRVIYTCSGVMPFFANEGIFTPL
jgi:hypothetical protein